MQFVKVKKRWQLVVVTFLSLIVVLFHHGALYCQVIASQGVTMCVICLLRVQKLKPASFALLEYLSNSNKYNFPFFFFFYPRELFLSPDCNPFLVLVLVHVGSF